MPTLSDVIVIGSGPAGLTTAIYAASEGLRTLILEDSNLGGQASFSSSIENFFGFQKGISGDKLTSRALRQARRFGAELLFPAEVGCIRAEGEERVVTLKNGDEFRSRTVVICSGVSYRQLKTPGLGSLTGRGVYYGSVLTEAATCRDSRVFVVGGANSAGQGAYYLAKYCSEVILCVRGKSVREKMSEYLCKKLESHSKVTIWTETELQAVYPDTSGRLGCVELLREGQKAVFPSAGLFIFIGASPRIQCITNRIQSTEKGYLKTGAEVERVYEKDPSCCWVEDRAPLAFETSLPGVFCAGDVREGSVKRVAAAVGEGSCAVSNIFEYLREV